MTEQELIHRCIKKDAAAQRALYEQYASQMMTVCRRYSSSQHLAEDLLQEGFVKVFTSLPQFRFEGSLEGWIKRIFVHCSLRKAEKKNLPVSDFSDGQQDNYFTEPAIFHQLSEEAILAMIRQLPEGYRLVFNLYVIDGYSHDEIGTLLGIAPVTSRTQLIKARKLLQQKINRSSTSKYGPGF